MHLVYSALNPKRSQQSTGKTKTGNSRLVRYQAYQSACNKYSSEIAAIQKYLPGWMPAFR